MPHILVKGAVPKDSQLKPVLAPRLEAYDFVKDTKLFSLYIKALRRSSSTWSITNFLSI